MPGSDSPWVGDGVLGVSGLLAGGGALVPRFGDGSAYDRRAQMGPWLVNRVVRRLHRHSAYVAIDDVQSLDWRSGVIRVDQRRLQKLRPA